MKVSKITAAVVVAAIAVGATAAKAAGPAVVPPIGLAPGSPYELIFVTLHGTTATDPNIAYYNSFVTTEAGLSSSSVVRDATWTAIVSTPTVNANANAPSTGLYPIYNTAGQLLEPAGTSIYTENPNGMVNAVEFDQFGNAQNGYGGIVYTGTGFNGVGWSGETLGDSGGFSRLSGSNDAFSFQGGWGDSSQDQPFPIFALSSPITSPGGDTPEPTSLGLLGLGAIGLLARRRRTA